MFKVAIIGPRESVERILSVSNDTCLAKLVFTPLIYESAIETGTIITSHYDDYDYFLFSGPIPYELAMRTKLNPDKFFSIVLQETGIYKALLNATKQCGKPVERLSADIISTSNIVSISLNQLNEPLQQLFIKTFDAAADYKQLYAHHLRLWEEKKIDAVLTCYPEVMTALLEKNIPAEWISTTKLATKQALEFIQRHAEISFLKRSQLGVCLVYIDSLLLDNPNSLSYDIQLATLKMNEELLLLSREMNGSFVSYREGQYMIFSSRGEIIATLPIIRSTMGRLERAWDIKIMAGIGFGDSALTAETHARKALRHGQQNDFAITLIDHEGQLTDLPEEYYGEHSIFKQAELIDYLKEHQVNIPLFDKVREAARRKKWTTFTAKELALELKISDRSAQRTLLSLYQAGIVIHAGEEKPVAKGRPSKLYEISEEFL